MIILHNHRDWMLLLLFTEVCSEHMFEMSTVFVRVSFFCTCLQVSERLHQRNQFKLVPLGQRLHFLYIFRTFPETIKISMRIKRNKDAQIIIL